MLFLNEINEDTVEVLVEADDNGVKSHFIEGIFLQADIKNKNNRIYPGQIMEKEVNRYVREFVNKNRAFGELGHGEAGSPSVKLERVSHLVKSLFREGSNFIGKAKIMDTPYGNIVKNLIDEGAKLAVSSRGVGTLKTLRNGIMEVQSDFILTTAADIVADPSAPNAFVQGIMEGRTWHVENGVLKEDEVANYQKEIRAATKRNIEDTKLRIFQQFLSKI